MKLATHEFIRRFLIYVLPCGFHRIRHYGLFANGNRAVNIARARRLLAMPPCSKVSETPEATAADEPGVLSRRCPCCGGHHRALEFLGRRLPRKCIGHHLASEKPCTAADLCTAKSQKELQTIGTHR